MNRMNSTFRNLATIIILIVLAAAAFWLVSQRAKPEVQPAAQVTDQPAPATAPPQSASTPMPAPTPSATPELVTPEYFFATVTFITPPPYIPPTPTSTPEPLTGQAIGGYVFSEARLVPDTIGYSWTFFDWLPDNPNKLLAVRDGISLETIDVHTGQTQIYHTGNTLINNAVWLPTRQAVAYSTVDEKDATKQRVWMSEAIQNQTISAPSSLIVTSRLSPLVTTLDSSGVILFDANWKLTQVGAINPQLNKLAANTAIYAPTSDDNTIYQAVQSPDKTRAIYFNRDWLLLADFTQGNLTSIDLATMKLENMPPLNHIQAAAWGKENKLALLIAAGGVYDGNNLFVLDLDLKKLTFIKNKFHYIAGLDWAPDNKHIIISGAIGEREGYNTNALFIVNIISGDTQPIAAVPADAIGVLPNWSPDGSQIAVLYANQPGNPGLYLIDVKLP